ncbi:helix-turn-helix domain-containing protein [Nocardioides sp. URHA0020]|uniref:helix-turn-helix domain-containing protein n=1 Tax=Nocardioides sp. URHA0020 TaxID=1380392 RepID=UPI00049027CA|nr:helix-turn-helix transcriptional regulator [Nocardioides sp. URHA0020]
MRAELVELTRTVDVVVLGARLRSARLRAGITQADVAGTAMSVGYVSRIESGQRRPDPDLLESMAARLGVDVEELLVGVSPDRVTELHVALDRAELALVTGSAAEALASAELLLADPDVATLTELRRSASYVRAGALEATGDVQAAILLLEDLAADERGDLAWIDGLTSLCRCYRDSGELGRAIEIGNQAARRIEELGLEGLDESIRLSLTVAAAYFEQGDADYAVRLCQRAVDRADAIDSPVAKAMAYWNSSAMESRRGNAAAALPLTQRALAVIEASQDARNVARLRTQLGIQHLLVDPPQPTEALEVLTRAADELALTSAAPADLADNRLAQARARFLLGETEVARQRATETVESVRSTVPLVAADALALLGQIAVHDGAVDAARTHFQEAVLLLSAVGADRSAAQLWFELAGLLETVGDVTAALDAYRRSAAATGMVASATRRAAPASAT